MANSTGSKKSGALLASGRKLLIVYLALTTGCTPVWQSVKPETSASSIRAAEHSSNGHISLISSPPQQLKQDTPQDNLPELYSGASSKDLAANKIAPVHVPHDQLFINPEASHDIRIADPRVKGFSGLEKFTEMSQGMASSALTDAVEGYFGEKRITAEVSVSAGENGLSKGSVDLLVPVYTTEDDLIFLQGGARRSNQYTESERTTANIGIGFRRTLGEWLFGFNGFFDKDLTGQNERLGFGAEVWTDNIKLSANTYHRLSDWKRSPDADNFLERPANGMDIRAEGYLPGYPQLSGRVMFEKYYGDEVGLFGSSNRQRDPSAATVGLTYTPVPLISLSADYKHGQNGESQSSFKVGLNYQPGLSLDKQLSPDAVASARKLSNARFNLVSRNNEIVLDYKQDDNGRITLPATLGGVPSTTLSFPLSVSGTVQNITWTGSAADFASAYNGTGAGSVTFPAIDAGGDNTYTLQAVGTGGNGLPVTSNVMTIGVEAMMIALDRSKPAAMADGSDAVTFTARLLKPTGEPQPDSTIAWDIQGAATVKEMDETTDSTGRARLSLVSSESSAVQVRASEPTGSQAESAVSFLGDPASARVVNVTAAPAIIAANGVDAITLTATIDDAVGNRVGAGVPVDWSTTIGDLSAPSSMTDANGQATASLTGRIAGSGTVTAGAEQGSASTDITITADNESARVVGLTAIPATIIANGSDSSSLTATVEDAGGNPVGSGVAVTWTATLGDISPATSITDSSGRTTVSLTGIQAGAATVTASAASGSSTAAVMLNADTSTARVIGLSASATELTADGADSSTLTATLTDANGNAAPAGVLVSWSTTLGELSATSSMTDATGRATVTFTTTQAGSASITASATAGSANVQILASADNSSARVVGLVASPATITANGADASTLTATLTDTNGNAVGAGVPVTWSTTLGELSSTSTITDAAGQAVVGFSGTHAGAATVTAAAAAGSNTVGITLQSDSATARVVTVDASDSTVAANGVSTSLLTATVVDANGNPADAGVSINWTSTHGDLSASASMTDAGGRATVTISSDAVGAATVTASAVNGSSSTSLAFIADVATSQVVSLTASSASITANGTDDSVLTAVVQDARGNSVGSGVAVNWSTTLGDLSSPVSMTDSTGKASLTFTGTVAGVGTVTAAATQGSATTNITLTADIASARVTSLVPAPAVIPANGSSSSTLTATVQDAGGNPVGAGVTVGWSTTHGSLVDVSSVTDSNGQATAKLTGTGPGTATVTASSTTGSATADVTLTADESTARVVNITATPTEITANGSEYTTLSATVVDANGHAMSAGVTVSWTTTVGSLASATSETDALGQATMTLASTQAGSATITASAVAGAADVQVQMSADTSSARVVELDASHNSIIADGSDTSTLTATLADAYGNAVSSGVPVTWSTTLGNLSAASSMTDANGRATVTISGLSAGAAVITASAVDGSSNITVDLVADTATARVVGLTASAAEITANGVEESTLTATVQDVRGNTVGSGVTVNWSTTLGSLSATSSVTDVNGRAVVKMASIQAGTATVTASATAGSANTQVLATADESSARVVQLTASRSSITADGADTSTLTATLADANGNTVGAGVSVAWVSTIGILSAGSTPTDVNGQAVVTLSGIEAGTATVTASGAGGSANRNVNLLSDAATATVTNVTASPTSIVANGSSTSTITAVVMDANSNPLGAGLQVSWSTTAGTLSSATSVTNASGVASVTLVSANTASNATVSATIGASTRTASVAFTAPVEECLYQPGSNYVQVSQPIPPGFFTVAYRSTTWGVNAGGAGMLQYNQGGYRYYPGGPVTAGAVLPICRKLL
uniref:Ig-like domain-containing protein n=1 Tax=Pseudomonas aeruginosa TaxID=287 RepID=UPI0015B7BD31|nr:Ig-like domain-containing protein [Pseudomonas aeruginosa]